MRRLALAVAAALACASTSAQTVIPQPAIDTAVQLRQQALADATGWNVVQCR